MYILMNVVYLPLELKYEIMNWLQAFDILNFSKALNIKLCKKYKQIINDEIIRYCNGNEYLKNIITNIIKNEGFINYDLLNVFDDIVYIIRKSSKYMDILGFNTYIFNLYKGTMFTSKHSIPIIYSDTQVINIYYPDIELLHYYLEKYMNFMRDINSYIYRINKHDMKKLLKFNKQLEF